MIYSEKLDKVGSEYVKILRSKIFTYFAFSSPLLVKKINVGQNVSLMPRAATVEGSFYHPY